MMNVNLTHIPERTEKPRNKGLTMMMDKGLSLLQVESFIEQNQEFTDFVKFGFGTACIANKLADKIKLYRQANIRPYFGGTLFEVFVARGQFEDYLRFLDKYDIDLLEVSDGSIVLDHDEKCEYIHKLKKERTVLSEVGSKEASIMISSSRWINMMKNELEAGSWKVIAEGRESGSVGIFRPNSTPHKVLINKIIANVDPDKILWEAPIKKQQVWFIKLFGQNVNLGNIAPNETTPLEALRLGLRGDTFFDFLPKKDVSDKLKQKP